MLALACGGKSTERLDTMRPDAATPVVAGNAGAGSAGGAGPIPPTQPIGGAGGEALSAGGEAPTAGTGPIDLCGGVVPRCTPGEVLCHPALGVTAICDECGLAQPENAGKPCARLIASDKESNNVCVVRGATDLQCWPAWSAIQSGMVPAETREVLLRDDGAASGNEFGGTCVRTADSAYSCFEGSDCSHVTVGDTAVCAICYGKVTCKGTLTLPAFATDPPIDMTITDSALFSLGAAGLAAYDLAPRLPEFWRGSPRELRVDHYTGGCIISTANEVACWLQSPTQPLIASDWTGFRKLVPMTLPRACVLDSEGRVGCGDVFVGAAPPRFDEADVVDLVASSSMACALTREGRVLCWDEQGAALELPPDW